MDDEVFAFNNNQNDDDGIKQSSSDGVVVVERKLNNNEGTGEESSPKKLEATTSNKAKEAQLLKVPQKGDDGSNGTQMLKHKRNASNSSGRSGTSLNTGAEKASEIIGTDIKLPQRFVVKYLGFRETTNLWGIKHTRKPVDEMVAEAKRSLSSKAKPLPLLKLEVVEDGILVTNHPQNTNLSYPEGKFAISSISYGVQDLVYTRVFAMIVVKTGGDKKSSGGGEPSHSKPAAALLDQNQQSPFRCHAFVTDTRDTAKNLTYALASAFQIFSQKVATGKIQVERPKKFAIDLRAQEDIEAEMNQLQVNDSEA